MMVSCQLFNISSKWFITIGNKEIPLVSHDHKSLILIPVKVFFIVHKLGVVPFLHLNCHRVDQTHVLMIFDIFGRLREGSFVQEAQSFTNSLRTDP
jgi:hypothetical protein